MADTIWGPRSNTAVQEEISIWHNAALQDTGALSNWLLIIFGGLTDYD